ncbi:MAG: Rpn family recombination-promoting nuclease/putative transposase, partial [Synergistaceae bacterium]|nr:Rpn family recombination-promoting nuclease/putative transposase [Synergistaceae bacterium]
RKWLLLDLINTILILMGYEPLADIRPMDRELSPDRPAGKGVRLDYLGRTISGRTINLEFQKRSSEDFIQRALYYGNASKNVAGRDGYCDGRAYLQAFRGRDSKAMLGQR